MYDKQNPILYCKTCKKLSDIIESHEICWALPRLDDCILAFYSAPNFVFMHTIVVFEYITSIFLGPIFLGDMVKHKTKEIFRKFTLAWKYIDASSPIYCYLKTFDCIADCGIITPNAHKTHYTLAPQ